VEADTTETEYGWIEPGKPPQRVVTSMILRVTNSRETFRGTKACLLAKCLWNTFVFVAEVSTLIGAGEPSLSDLS
jgi:mannose-1-phosphate guanylyltransferase